MSLRDEWLADPEPLSYAEWLRRRTVPPTLLVLQSPQEQRQERAKVEHKVERKQTERAERKAYQRKSRAMPGGRELVHGSTHAFKRHIAAGEDPCAECVAGHEAEKARRAADKRAYRKRRQPPQCGTPQKARKHRRDNEEVCEACRKSERDEWHRRQARNRQADQTPRENAA